MAQSPAYFLSLNRHLITKRVFVFLVPFLVVLNLLRISTQSTKNVAIDGASNVAFAPILSSEHNITKYFSLPEKIQGDRKSNSTLNIASPTMEGDSKLRQNTNSVSLASKPEDEPLTRVALPPIHELAESSNYTCPEGLVRINDTHLPENVTHFGRKIPAVIHMTAKSRCVTPAVFKHLEHWRFPGHSFYFHDDEAVDRLLYANHTGTADEIVVNFTKVLSCVTSGATKSDIWRYLLLWHYGGIYSDIDNSATGFDGESILPDYDSFFVVEKLGTMSQFFLASSPSHPLMIHALKHGIDGLRNSVNVMVNNPAHKTGPGAIKNAFVVLQAAVGIIANGYVNAGTYEGALDRASERRNVTVVGTAQKHKEYINRGGLSLKEKQAYFSAANMSGYLWLSKKYPRQGRISCMEHIRRQQLAHNGAYYEVANYKPVNGTYVEV